MEGSWKVLLVHIYWGSGGRLSSFEENMLIIKRAPIWVQEMETPVHDSNSPMMKIFKRLQTATLGYLRVSKNQGPRYRPQTVKGSCYKDTYNREPQSMGTAI